MSRGETHSLDGWTRARLGVVLGLLAAALAGCSTAGTTSRTTAPSTTSPATTTTTVSSQPRRVFSRSFLSPRLSLTAAGDYLSWTAGSTALGPLTDLARVDLATGTVGSTRELGAVDLGSLVAARGSLWVATASASGGALLQLNPVSLALRHRLSSTASTEESVDSLTLAGGWLWVAAGGRLLRVSLRTARVRGSVAMPGAATSSVGSNSAGNVLVDGEADSGGQGAVQRRDARTGGLLASHPMGGIVAPRILVVAGGGVWAAEPTGMMGYLERFEDSGMRAEPKTMVEGTNGISASLEGGLLWVTRPAGDYCADPHNGRVLARVPLPDPAADSLIGVEGDSLFYAASRPDDGGRSYVEEEPIPTACG